MKTMFLKVGIPLTIAAVLILATAGYMAEMIVFVLYTAPFFIMEDVYDIIDKVVDPNYKPALRFRLWEHLLIVIASVVIWVPLWAQISYMVISRDQVLNNT